MIVLPRTLATRPDLTSISRVSLGLFLAHCARDLIRTLSKLIRALRDSPPMICFVRRARYCERTSEYPSVVGPVRRRLPLTDRSYNSLAFGVSSKAHCGCRFTRTSITRSHSMCATRPTSTAETYCCLSRVLIAEPVSRSSRVDI